jgi:hypothetical protein
MATLFNVRLKKNSGLFKIWFRQIPLYKKKFVTVMLGRNWFSFLFYFILLLLSSILLCCFFIYVKHFRVIFFYIGCYKFWYNIKIWFLLFCFSAVPLPEPSLSNGIKAPQQTGQSGLPSQMMSSSLQQQALNLTGSSIIFQSGDLQTRPPTIVNVSYIGSNTERAARL